MNTQLNHNVFDQSTAARDRGQRVVGLATIIPNGFQQSFGLAWPEKSQAENGERTRIAALARLSIHFAVRSVATLMESQCKEWLPPGKHRASPKEFSPAPGVVVEDIEIAYRVALSLVEREQITLARKALDALPVRVLGDPTILRLRKTLAAPVTNTSEKRDIDRTVDYQWIRDHAQDYRGQWVALDNGKLLGAAASLRALLDRVKPLQSERRPLLHQIS